MMSETLIPVIIGTVVLVGLILTCLLTAYIVNRCINSFFQDDVPSKSMVQPVKCNGIMQIRNSAVTLSQQHVSRSSSTLSEDLTNDAVTLTIDSPETSPPKESSLLSSTSSMFVEYSDTSDSPSSLSPLKSFSNISPIKLKIIFPELSGNTPRNVHPVDQFSKLNTVVEAKEETDEAEKHITSSMRFLHKNNKNNDYKGLELDGVTITRVIVPEESRSSTSALSICTNISKYPAFVRDKCDALIDVHDDHKSNSDDNEATRILKTSAKSSRTDTYINCVHDYNAMRNVKSVRTSNPYESDLMLSSIHSNKSDQNKSPKTKKFQRKKKKKRKQSCKLIEYENYVKGQTVSSTEKKRRLSVVNLKTNRVVKNKRHLFEHPNI